MDGKDINKNIGDYVSKVSANNYFKGALLLLGVAFTVSTVVNNWYSISQHRARMKAEREAAKNGKID